MRCTRVKAAVASCLGVAVLNFFTFNVFCKSRAFQAFLTNGSQRNALRSRNYLSVTDNDFVNLLKPSARHQL